MDGSLALKGARERHDEVTELTAVDIEVKEHEIGRSQFFVPGDQLRELHVFMRRKLAPARDPVDMRPIRSNTATDLANGFLKRAVSAAVVDQLVKASVSFGVVGCRLPNSGILGLQCDRHKLFCRGCIHPPRSQARGS